MEHPTSIVGGLVVFLQGLDYVLDLQGEIAGVLGVGDVVCCFVLGFC